MRVCGLCRISATGLRRLVDVDGAHRGAMDHHVGDFQIVQVEQPAQPVAILLHERALAVQHSHRSPQFLMPGQHRLPLQQIDAECRQEVAHDPVDRGRKPAEQEHRKPRERRDEQRELLGPRQCPALRQYLGENHQQHGHADRGVDNAGIAEQLQKH
jgi:hypothetical protein